MNDVYVVNLACCSEVQIKEEVNTIPNPPPLLNIQRVSASINRGCSAVCRKIKTKSPPFQIATRKRNAVDEKRRLVLALTAGVTPEGQKLFMAISKTIGPQVTWQGSDICVFGDTFVTHPYRPENVRGSSDRRVVYVKKLVESQWKDVVQPPAPPTAAASATESSNNSVVASNGANTSNASSAAAVTSSSNNTNNQLTSATSAN